MLPRSFATYIIKQYEIIDINTCVRYLKTYLHRTASDWLSIKSLQFTWYRIPFFYFIFLRNRAADIQNKLEINPIIENFIKKKKSLRSSSTLYFYHRILHAYRLDGRLSSSGELGR
jgi:hypothetical protein